MLVSSRHFIGLHTIKTFCVQIKYVKYTKGTSELVFVDIGLHQL